MEKIFTEFITRGQNAGFTDEQLNFMWEFMERVATLKALSGGFL